MVWRECESSLYFCPDKSIKLLNFRIVLKGCIVDVEVELDVCPAEWKQLLRVDLAGLHLYVRQQQWQFPVRELTGPRDLLAGASEMRQFTDAAGQLALGKEELLHHPTGQHNHPSHQFPVAQ